MPREDATELRLPRLERYLSRLPGGLEAHPGAQTRGVLVRLLLEGYPRSDLLAVLDEPLRRLAVDPPMDSDWVSEVHLMALTRAVADVRGLDDAALIAWHRERNRALALHPVFALLLSFVSADAVFRLAAARWASWHRGSTLEVIERREGWGRLELRFPSRLYDTLALRSLAGVFTAVLEASRAPSPGVTLEWADDERAHYLARW
jgi:hypothetical protein